MIERLPDRKSASSLSLNYGISLPQKILSLKMSNKYGNFFDLGIFLLWQVPIGFILESTLRNNHYTFSPDL